MSAFKIIAALEEFEQEVASELAVAAPTIDETISGHEEVTAESDGIDEDIQALQAGGDALESIITLVSEMPTPMDKPLEPFARRAMQMALEANDLIAGAANTALATTDDKGETKKDFLDKAKDFAKKVWEALASMAAKVLEWIKGIWAKVTDRLLKNSNRAKKHLEALSQLNTRPGAKIENERVLKAVANSTGADVGDIVVGVFDHARAMAGKNSVEMARQAGLLVEAVAGGRTDNEALQSQFLELLVEGAGDWKDSSMEQSKALPNSEGTKTYVSEDFFGGNVAWLAVPSSPEKLDLWNHGISKAAEPKAINPAAPDVSELEAICKHIATGQDLIRIYQVSTKPLDELAKKLKAAIAKEKGDGDKKLVRSMQAVIPRIIKGPQVSAYNYAGAASSIALAYVDAALEAHQATGEAKGGSSLKDKTTGIRDKAVSAAKAAAAAV